MSYQSKSTRQRHDKDQYEKMGKEPLPYTGIQIAFYPELHTVPTVLSDCIGVSTTTAESNGSHVPETIFKGPIMHSISLKDNYLFLETDDSGSDSESTTDVAEEPSKSVEEILREWVWENNPSVNSVMICY